MSDNMSRTFYTLFKMLYCFIPTGYIHKLISLKFK